MEATPRKRHVSPRRKDRALGNFISQWVRYEGVREESKEESKEEEEEDREDKEESKEEDGDEHRQEGRHLDSECQKCQEHQESHSFCIFPQCPRLSRLMEVCGEVTLLFQIGPK